MAHTPHRPDASASRAGCRARDIRPLSSCSPPSGERPRRHLRAAGHPTDPAGPRGRLPRRPSAGWDLRRRLSARTRPADPPARHGDTTIRHGQHGDPHAPRAARGRRPRSAGQLLDIAHRNVADALRLCHRALELDGADHGYGPDEWLPIVYDIAGSLLQSARLDAEPPTIVRVTQEAISWLSRAIAELDRGSQGGRDQPRRDARSPARRLDVHRRRATARPARLAASADCCSTPFATSHSTATSRSIETTSTPLLVALHSGRADHAKDGQRPAAAPPPPATSKPPSLLAHPAELALVIRSGLRLDREPHAVRRDHDRVDVPAARPRDDDAPAIPVPRAARGRGAPRPQSELRPRCARPGTASAEPGDRPMTATARSSHARQGEPDGAGGTARDSRRAARRPEAAGAGHRRYC